jgi:hypothetical protein
LHGPLKKNNKNSGKNKIRSPTPWPPGGAIFSFVKVFLENIRRSSVRVQKLHRGFILTKKGDINPPKNSEGAFLGFFFENFKSCPMVPKLWI